MANSSRLIEAESLQMVPRTSHTDTVTPSYPGCWFKPYLSPLPDPLPYTHIRILTCCGNIASKVVRAFRRLCHYLSSQLILHRKEHGKVCELCGCEPLLQTRLMLCRLPWRPMRCPENDALGRTAVARRMASMRKASVLVRSKLSPSMLGGIK